LIFAILALLNFGMAEVLTFYFLNPPFCWSSEKIGIYSGYDFVVKGVCGILFIKLFQGCLPYPAIALLGLLSFMGSYLIMANSTTILGVYIAPVVGLLSQTATPIIRTIASRMVELSEQGSLFSSMAWIQLFCTALGGMVIQTVYAMTMSEIHGFIYYLAALLVCVPIILLMYVHFVFYYILLCLIYIGILHLLSGYSSLYIYVAWDVH
jgi:PCFT/HCP family folate transporter-like MFS transporter 1/3